MSAIEASTVKVGTMADGTLRLTLDIEPRDAKAAFNLFGAPGTHVALAALKPAPVHSRREEAAQPELPKGGALARLAAQWCNTKSFHDWCHLRWPAQVSATQADMGAELSSVTSEEAAAEKLFAEFVRRSCRISSRAELDSNPEARARFDRLFRLPYSEHLNQAQSA